MQDFRNIILSLGAALAGTKLVRSVSELGADDVLAPLGLRRRRTRVGTDIALLGAGMLLGGAVALIFAPASGRATRQRLAKKADELGDAATDRLRELRDDVRPHLGNAHPETRHS